MFACASHVNRQRSSCPVVRNIASGTPSSLCVSNSFVRPPLGDRPGPASGHKKGTTGRAANVCLLGTRCATLRSVKYFTWSDAKNERLKADRGIGFEEIVFLIGHGHVLDILEHPNQQRCGGQRIFVVQRDDYVYLVPFVEDDKLIALKTIVPSRKATKQYLGKERDDHEA
jgi:hypothetical protein